MENFTVLAPKDILARSENPQRIISVGSSQGARAARRPVTLLFRNAYKAAGLGRLSMAWFAAAYPRTGKTLVPSVFVSAKGGEQTRAALSIHGTGGIIRARRSKYLAVPTPLAGKYVTTGAGRKRITPRLFEMRTGIKLQFIPRRGSRPPLLVAADVRVSGRGRVRAPKGGATTKTGRLKSGISTAVIFILVPLVRVSKRANLRQLKKQGAQLVAQSVNAGISDAAVKEARQ